MLRNRFSVALLALLLATAIPGSASAADTSNDATSQVTAPVLQSASADGSEEGQTPDVATPDAIPPEQEPLEAAPPAGSEEPADVPGEVTESAIETQEPKTEVETPTEIEPAEDETAPETPSVDPDEVLPPEESTGTEPAIVVGEPVTEPAIVVDPEIIAPVEPIVTEPAIVVEEVVTEPAIVVEPMAATLTITHRLVIGDKQFDQTQTIEGLETGQTIDLNQYSVAEAWIECITNIDTITLDEEQNSITLEYRPVDGVMVIPSEGIN